MNYDNEEKQPRKPNILTKLDASLGKIIPSFNVRAILYFSLIFAVAIYFQVWRIASHKTPPTGGTQGTVVADKKYWDSDEYKNKIKNQTVETFTSELQRWLVGSDQEFSKRKFQDMFFINPALTKLTNDDMKTLDIIVPESFNYLENIAKARYIYAKENGFLSESPTMIKHGVLVCDEDDKVERDTGIEVYEWRYASMPKLAEFMKTNPDWKSKVGDRIFDVSDPRIEDKDFLKSKDSQSQPVGLFSFLVFKNTQINRIYLADSEILDKNGVDSALSMSRIGFHFSKQPKLYFKYGYDGCRRINDEPKENYGQSD